MNFLCQAAYGERRVEKYRPVTLDDVVSHKEITGTSKCYMLLLSLKSTDLRGP